METRGDQLWIIEALYHFQDQPDDYGNSPEGGAVERGSPVAGSMIEHECISGSLAELSGFPSSELCDLVPPLGQHAEADKLSLVPLSLSRIWPAV